MTKDAIEGFRRTGGLSPYGGGQQYSVVDLIHIGYKPFMALNTQSISKTLLAILMIAAGIMHFVNPAFFLKIMPPYIPLHKELVRLSGVCELLLGILLLIPAYSRWAAWGIVALLIAVFPANLHVFQHQELIPAPPIVHLLRLPLQGIFILWAYWHTSVSNAET